MKLFIHVHDGEAWPQWYAPAWHDYATNSSVTAPWGLHLILGWSREFYYRIARLSPAFRARYDRRRAQLLQMKAWREGHEAGQKFYRDFNKAWLAIVKQGDEPDPGHVSFPRHPENPYGEAR